MSFCSIAPENPWWSRSPHRNATRILCLGWKSYIPIKAVDLWIFNHYHCDEDGSFLIPCILERIYCTLFGKSIKQLIFSEGGLSEEAIHLSFWVMERDCVFIFAAAPTRQKCCRNVKNRLSYWLNCDNRNKYPESLARVEFQLVNSSFFLFHLGISLYVIPL